MAAPPGSTAAPSPAACPSCPRRVPLAGATQGFDDLARSIAEGTNAVHRTGFTSSGAAGGAFFSFTGTADSLMVTITDPAQLAHAGKDRGSLDGSIADAIGDLGTSATSGWTGFVSGIGASSRSALNGLSLSVGTESSARASQQSLASVDRDEEAVNLITFQHAYQASARVLTAVDEMLDTLINRVGLVGR